MASKRTVQHDLRFECLKYFELFDKNQNLLPESNKVWEDACQKLNLKKEKFV